MSAHPIVILHTDRPAAALSVLHETHPDLTVHACDSYAGLYGSTISGGRANATPPSTVSTSPTT